MSEELAIEILKQATIDTITGSCEKCPRKDKNKTCIGCLDEAKENILNQLQQKENIIKEARKEVRIYEEQSNDGTTNELDNYVFVQRLKNVLDKENKE